MRFLIIDGYDRAARAELEQAGAHLASTLYTNMLRAHRPQANVTVVFAADLDCPLPDLDQADAMLWTGSSLTAYHDIPEVSRQIELVRAGFEMGVPAFGSCWALQIATLAAGGEVRKNPNGREFGLARKITLTNAGHEHAIFRGRALSFDGFSSHFDEVARLPEGSLHLAGNAHTRVQAAEICYQKGRFIGLQYHPEYDLGEIAALTRFRAAGLIDEGRFENMEALRSFVTDFESLNQTSELSLSWKYGVDQDVMKDKIKHNEFSNWLDSLENR